MMSLKSEKDAFFEKLQFYTQYYYQGFGLAVPSDPCCPNVALWYPASRGSSLAWLLTLMFTKSISSLHFENVKSHAKDKPRLAR